MRDESTKIPPVVASDPRGSALVRTLPSSGPSSSSKELCKERNACRCSSGRAATFLEMESRTYFLEFPPRDRGTLNNGDSERMRVPLMIVVAATRPWPLPGISWIVYKRSQIALCMLERLCRCFCSVIAQGRRYDDLNSDAWCLTINRGVISPIKFVE